MLACDHEQGEGKERGKGKAFPLFDVSILVLYFDNFAVFISNFSTLLLDFCEVLICIFWTYESDASNFYSLRYVFSHFDGSNHWLNVFHLILWSF